MKPVVALAVVLVAILAFVWIDAFPASEPNRPGPGTVAEEVGAESLAVDARSALSGGSVSPDDADGATSSRREAAPDSDLGLLIVRGTVRGPAGEAVEGALIELAVGSEADVKKTSRQPSKGGKGKVAGKQMGKGGSKAMSASSFDLGEPSTTRTDAEGRYEIALAPRGEPDWVGVLSARADGLRPEAKFLSFDAASVVSSSTGAEPRVVDLSLEAEIRLRGRVLGVLAKGAAGSPLEGATVTPWGSGEPGQTDAEGYFDLPGFGAGDEDVWLNVDAPGYIATWASARMSADADPIEVELLAGASVRGVVVHAGQPVPGAQITARFGKFVQTVESDDEGRFVLQGLPSGSLSIHADHRDFPEARREILVPSAPGIAEVTFVLDAARTLVGVVRDPDGVPVEGATVAMRRGKERGESVKTNADGEFELGGLPLDSYVLFCQKGGYLPVRDLEILRGQTSVEIELRPAAGVAVTVVDAETGEPLPVFEVLELPADLQLEVDDKRVLYGRWETGKNGVYRSDPLRWEPGAEVQLRIRAQNYPTMLRSLHTASIDPKPALRVQLRKGALLRLLLLTDRGVPLEGARVSWQGVPAGYDKQAPSTDAQGRVELAGVPSGSPRLRIEHEEWGRVYRSVDVPFGVASVEAVVRLEPLASLSGRVLTLDGRPVANVPVRLMLQEDGWRSARVVDSDAAGRFRFDRVAPGEYRIARIEAADPTGNAKQLELFARLLTVEGSDPVEVDVIAPGSARVVASLSAPVPVPDLVYVRLDPLAEGGGPDRWARARNGSVTFDGMADGRYALIAEFFDASRSQTYSARLEVDLDPESTSNVTLSFEAQQGGR